VISRKLTGEGKIPHDVELQKHPEKSLEGKSWLMGDVSALINVSTADAMYFGGGTESGVGYQTGQADH
jgi:hypothetical protein